MINKFLDKPILVLAVIGLLIFVSIPFQKKIDSQRSKFRSIEETLHLSSSTLKKASLGFDELLSDIYWFRAIQYLGSDDIKFTEKDSDLVFKYFDIITDLDPKFVNAYRFGGTFLSEPLPHGLNDVSRGSELFSKGRINNNDNFRLPLDEGFIHYIYTKDYRKAAELFEEASKKPGLSDFRSSSLRGMAASALKRGGDRELSKQLWEYIYNTTQNESRKNYALQNLNELNTKDFEDRLTKIVLQYKNDIGVFPNSLNELVSKRYLKKIPRDYKGEEFIISHANKSVRSKALSKKELDENVRFLNAKARRYKLNFGKFPESVKDLQNFFQETASFEEFREHPLGEEYLYNPETGIVDYDKSFLN